MQTNNAVTSFADLDQLPGLELNETLEATDVDVSAARLIKAIESNDAKTYVEIVSTPKGRATLAQLGSQLRELARQLGDRVASQSDTSELSAPVPPEFELTPLAKRYLANAVSSLTRVPSPRLKPDFRSTLMHWRSILIVALKTQNEPMALVTAALAITASEGAFDAVRLLRNVGTQVLWQVSIDIARDRRTASEAADETPPVLDEGQTTHEPSDTVTPPDEWEAKDAYVLAHAWLSTVADQLAVDEDDRARLGLESGLEYITVRNDELGTWDRVYDVDQAIEIQLEKNRQSMVRRNADVVMKRKATLLAIARMAA